MRIALYGRQSIDKKDSISIETQLEKGRLECAPGDSIVIYEDRGYSGKNTKRPGFKRLMEDAEKGHLDRIIVYKLDRFSRSILDFANAWEILSRNHVEFVSINEKFDTGTPLGKAMLYIAIVFAQMERETIAERVKDNYYERVKRGSWMGGPAPYGYKIGRLLSQEGNRIPTLMKEAELTVASRIFEMYAEDENLSLGRLAAYLTDELKIPGPKRATWNNVSLARMIKNPVYVKCSADIYSYYKEKGIRIFNCPGEFDDQKAGLLIGKGGGCSAGKEVRETPSFALANWEGTVPAHIWLRCQEKLARNEQIKNSGKGKYTWLSGLLKCGNCKRSFRVITDQRYPEIKRLYCSGRTDKICSCTTRIKVNEVEFLVEKELNKILEECGRAPILEEPVMDNDKKIRLENIEGKKQNLLVSLSSQKAGDTMIALVNEELEKLEQEKKNLLAEALEQARIKSRQYEKVDFQSRCMEDKKIIAISFIKYVEVSDESIVIGWRA